LYFLIVNFPETRAAVIEHFGPAALEHEIAKKLITWKTKRRLTDPLQHRSCGIHTKAAAYLFEEVGPILA